MQAPRRSGVGFNQTAANLEACTSLDFAGRQELLQENETKETLEQRVSKNLAELEDNLCPQTKQQNYEIQDKMEKHRQI